jgi:hypothetical protein
MEGDDRAFIDKGQMFVVPHDGVYLSKRAFKHYAKGCES